MSNQKFLSFSVAEVNANAAGRLDSLCVFMNKFGLSGNVGERVVSDFTDDHDYSLTVRP